MDTSNNMPLPRNPDLEGSFGSKVAIVIIVLIVLLGGAYFFMTRNSQKMDNVQTEETVTSPSGEELQSELDSSTNVSVDAELSNIDKEYK